MVVSAIVAIRMARLERSKKLTVAPNVGEAETFTVADLGETQSTELV